jgi:hypothetical protein
VWAAWAVRCVVSWPDGARPAKGGPEELEDAGGSVCGAGTARVGGAGAGCGLRVAATSPTSKSRAFRERAGDCAAVYSCGGGSRREARVAVAGGRCGGCDCSFGWPWLPCWAAVAKASECKSRAAALSAPWPWRAVDARYAAAPLALVLRSRLHRCVMLGAQHLHLHPHSITDPYSLPWPFVLLCRCAAGRPRRPVCSTRSLRKHIRSHSPS